MQWVSRVSHLYVFIGVEAFSRSEAKVAVEELRLRCQPAIGAVSAGSWYF